jgi:nickel transport protein
MINTSAFAHKVNIFAYVEGEKIYTESYFSDGKKCLDSKIEVFDNRENKLLEGLTDEEGMFSFEFPPEDAIDGDLRIVLIASMGHRAEYIIRTDELEGFEGLVKEKSEEPIPVVSTEISPFDLKENALDEKLELIMREMREIKKFQEDRLSLTDIVGGIGYIIGIFGIIAYFLSRKR